MTALAVKDLIVNRSGIAVVRGVDLGTTALPLFTGAAAFDRQLTMNEDRHRRARPVVPGRYLRIHAIAGEDLAESAARRKQSCGR